MTFLQAPQVDLKDQSGEMSATFFGRAVDKYYSMLKCGQASTVAGVNIGGIIQGKRKDRKVPYPDLSNILAWWHGLLLFYLSCG